MASALPVKKPETTWHRTLTHDVRLSAYRIQLIPGFVKVITESALRSPALANYVHDFTFAIRTVEVTANLPYHVVSQLKHFVDAYIKSRDEPKAQKIAGAIAANLVRELDIADAGVLHQIGVKCLELGARADKLPFNESPFSVDEIWDSYRVDPGFQLALNGSQRHGFVAAYSAYEEFLCRCIAIANGFKSFRKKGDEKFAGHLKKAFGDAFHDECWEDGEFKLFRAARHSLVHAGGHVTDELKEMDHPFIVEDDIIRIGPEHLSYALVLVQSGSGNLVQAALSHPKFKSK